MPYQRPISISIGRTPNRVIASSRAWNLLSTKDKYGAPGHRFRRIFARRSSVASCANSVAISCNLGLVTDFEPLVVFLLPGGRADHMAECVFRHLSQLCGRSGRALSDPMDEAIGVPPPIVEGRSLYIVTVSLRQTGSSSILANRKRRQP